jgi:predicted acyl esterase
VSSAVEVVRHEWIPLADGTRLAARIWRPYNAADCPVPAILEYIPYRKNDGTAARDVSLHLPIAQAGYAIVRVDLRGSGDSDGILPDEYSSIELSDALEVISWIAAQPWCDGGVGIIGKSWGAFNGLQIAALQPPALKAVISVCGTDDRYAEDVHYTGGSLLASEMLPWASTMLAYQARPPDPSVVGSGWREQWRERLRDTPPYVHAWLSHQRRDDYWKHGSVCEDYSAITVPVLAVGGWYDPYRTSVFRLLKGLPELAYGLIGPWAHNYPHQGVPGPAIDFHSECLRWWDHWLKDLDTDVQNNPRLRVWLSEPAPPGPDAIPRIGRWVASSSVANRVFPLDTSEVSLPSDRDIGADAGTWMAFGDLAGHPIDQAADDGRSQTYTLPPLTDRLEIIGVPSLDVRFSADQPNAQLAVRLCDVDEAGASRLVTAGLFNLTHRDSHEKPEPAQPGETYRLTIPLQPAGHVFTPGHRIRVSISSAYWPWAWPSPTPVTVTLSASELHLPIHRDDGSVLTFAPPRAEPASPVTTGPGSAVKTVTRDAVSGRVTVTIEMDDGEIRDSTDGLRSHAKSRDRFTVVPTEPETATVECFRTIAVGRGSWRTKVVTASRMTCDATSFLVTNRLAAYEGDEVLSEHTWSFTVPRDHV